MTSPDLHHPQKSLVPCGFCADGPETIGPEENKKPPDHSEGGIPQYDQKGRSALLAFVRSGFPTQDEMRVFAAMLLKVADKLIVDEYGSVQQHLQPRHIQEMLIPIPDDWRMAQNMIDAGNRFMQAMESMSQADLLIRDHGFDLMI